MPQAVETNEMQPESETSEQSLQELEGTSQETVITDLKSVDSSRDDWKEFKCPICLDILKNTRITKNCFHRFCKDCIITALRRGKKECPICRRKVISKRSLDPDPQFDALIRKMYPGCNKEEASEENVSVKRKYKTQQALSFRSEKEQERGAQQEQQIETNNAWEGNHDSSPSNHASISSNDEACHSKKRMKTSSGREHDSKDPMVTINAMTHSIS
ncbi:E3 ubiquitin-protein ligase RING2-like [Acomys russatus]|uniref:E3 ubiquitin-protein ligase RING2-like n=1 Tax=Acomys russatus TaxID=60746 RepID=UPI0021E33B66|nr:E3 ubiquitin-protein ligase RING2-like [Acomys russatus]